MEIRLLLIDDEPVARLGIRARLKHHADFIVVEEAASAEEALEKIERLHPDAIFLDIEMLHASGLDLARMLHGSHKPLIVFLTAHRHYAVQAFDAEAVDYLLKPIHDQRFEVALDRLREAVMQRRSAEPHAVTKASPSSPAGKIAITGRRKTLLLETGEIDWIGAAGDYTQLHVRGKVHMFREPLAALMKRLPPREFARIHRSTIVNVSRIADVAYLRNRDLLLTLNDGTTLRVSRSYSKHLEALLRLDPSRVPVQYRNS